MLRRGRSNFEFGPQAARPRLRSRCQTHRFPSCSQASSAAPRYMEFKDAQRIIEACHRPLSSLATTPSLWREISRREERQGRDIQHMTPQLRCFKHDSPRNKQCHARHIGINTGDPGMSVNEGGIASGHTYCHTYPLRASAVPVTPITTLLYVAVARRKSILPE
jgi:hypothetical protein